MTPTTTATPTDRDRLAQAFARLARHGVLACAGLTGTADDNHAFLRAGLAARYPDGMGSYVFSTRSDEDRFDGDGRLRTALPLHCSTDDVALAVRVACLDAGLDPRATVPLTA